MTDSTSTVRATALRLARRIHSIHLPVRGFSRPIFLAAYFGHVALLAAVRWLVRAAWYEPPFRARCHVVGDGLVMERLPYISGPGQISLGRDVRLSGKSSFHFSAALTPAPTLLVSDRTFIGHGCTFAVAQAILIGRDCLIAAGVRMADHDGHSHDALRRRGGAPDSEPAPVTINDDAWIGANATILKGVTIGARSIVGAASVVTRDVPADTIVAGNPARIIRTLTKADSLRVGTLAPLTTAIA